jgi:PKHD-type hydroxylase
MWYFKDVSDQKYAWLPLLNDEQCDHIINSVSTLNLEQAKVGNGQDATVKPIRNNKVAWLPMEANSGYYTLYQACARAVETINASFFQYDLLGMETLQFASYDSNGSHFDKHVDNGLSTPVIRKLTFSIQLSDENSYTGGDLILYAGNTPTVLPRTRGVVSFFPSWTLHEVTPITSGVRNSLVGWCHGPKFK